MLTAKCQNNFHINLWEVLKTVVTRSSLLSHQLSLSKDHQWAPLVQGKSPQQLIQFWCWLWRESRLLCQMETHCTNPYQYQAINEEMLWPLPSINPYHWVSAPDSMGHGLFRWTNTRKYTSAALLWFTRKTLNKRGGREELERYHHTD